MVSMRSGRRQSKKRGGKDCAIRSFTRNRSRSYGRRNPNPGHVPPYKRGSPIPDQKSQTQLNFNLFHGRTTPGPQPSPHIVRRYDHSGCPLARRDRLLFHHTTSSPYATLCLFLIGVRPPPFPLLALANAVSQLLSKHSLLFPWRSLWTFPRPYPRLHSPCYTYLGHLDRQRSPSSLDFCSAVTILGLKDVADISIRSVHRFSDLSNREVMSDRSHILYNITGLYLEGWTGDSWYCTSPAAGLELRFRVSDV
jgi:hypothetical protein